MIRVHSSTHPSPRAFGAIACLVVTVLGSAAIAGAADPFYMAQMRDGSIAYSRGDFERATRRLRIACFGMLDEPELLADCLVRLGLAYSANGDDDGFLDTFQRLVLIEERFEAYSQAELGPGMRVDFETAVETTVPPEVLSISGTVWNPQPAPAPIVPAGPAPEATSTASRTSAPEGSTPPVPVAPVPVDVGGLVAQGTAELAEGRAKRARNSAQEALAEEPGRQDAICLRGRAELLLGICPAGLAGLDNCSEDEIDPQVTIAQLDCLVSLQRWQEAVDLFESLPEAAYDNKRVTKLGSKAQKKLAQQAPATAPAVAPGAAPSTTSPPVDQETLDSVRADLAAADAGTALDPILARAVALADASPDWRDAQLLAAETAYQASRWSQAVTYFQRAGEPDESAPALLFYYSVALYESGDLETAAEVLERALPLIEQGAFVRRYRDLILGGTE